MGCWGVTCCCLPGASASPDHVLLGFGRGQGLLLFWVLQVVRCQVGVQRLLE